MFLPLRLTWNLQMPRNQKIGIFVLFGSGFICIAFATIRCLQVGVDGSGKATTPEPKWLMLWTILECSIGMKSLLTRWIGNVTDLLGSHNDCLFTRLCILHSEAHGYEKGIV